MSNSEIVQFLTEKHAAFLQAVAGVDQRTSCLQPAPGQWSVGEAIHHVIMVERTVRQLIRSLRWGLLGEKQTGGAPKPARLERVSRREGRAKTMKRFIPSHGQPVDRLLHGLDRERRKTLRLARRVNLARLRQRSFRHYILGHLNGEEWLLFIGHHQERHRRQIEEILQRVKNGWPVGRLSC
jgi:hypothetical protein